MTINIPTPCHEKWQNFSPTANGGFCSSCQKEVIDFTRWKSEDIRMYFLKRPNGACGRFRASQLQDYPSSTEFVFQAPLRWITPSLVIASLTFTATTTVAQTSNNISINVPDVSPASHEMNFNVSDTTARRLKGRVIDAENHEMPGVNVALKGTTTATVTDASGEYTLEIEKLSAPGVLVFSFIGMITQEVEITDRQEINVMLQFDEVVLSEVIVVGGAFVSYRWYSPRGWWYSVKGIFRRKR